MGLAERLHNIKEGSYGKVFAFLTRPVPEGFGLLPSEYEISHIA